MIYVFPDQMRNHAMGFWDEPGFRENVAFRADPVYTPNLNAFGKGGAGADFGGEQLPAQQSASWIAADRDVS